MPLLGAQGRACVNLSGHSPVAQQCPPQRCQLLLASRVKRAVLVAEVVAIPAGLGMADEKKVFHGELSPARLT